MLNKYDLYEKEYIKLSKRLNELNDEIRSQPYIEVTPFQRGWETTIVLRDDISNRKDADFIQHLIDIGYKEFKTIRRLEYVKLIKRGIYWYEHRYKDHIHVEDFIPDKIKFSEKQYESLSDREKNYFYKDVHFYHNYINYYINIPHYWITLKVSPCMYDRIMDKNGKLESEYAKIRSKLQKPPYSKYYYGSRCIGETIRK